MAKDEKPSSVEEDKMAKYEKPSSVSATELAQALIEALQQNAATRGETRVVTPSDDEIIAAISQYQDIEEDLETLPLSR